MDKLDFLDCIAKVGADVALTDEEKKAMLDKFSSSKQGEKEIEASDIGEVAQFLVDKL